MTPRNFYGLIVGYADYEIVQQGENERVKIVVADITKQSVDAIVNAANRSIWEVASSFDFERIANLLPDELRTEAVMNYARALRILSMTA